MVALRHLWHELVRDRAPAGVRFFRQGRKDRSGVALVIVMAFVMFMTVVGTELAFSAQVQLKMATNQRDEAAAEGLAKSGLSLYRLLLVAAKGADSNLGQQAKQFGFSGDLIWQMVPFIDTGILRMIFINPSADEDDVARLKSEGLTDEELDESREDVAGPKHNFLDFDGDFYAEVADESAKINITGICAKAVSEHRDCEWAELTEDPVYLQLQAMFTGEVQCDYAESLVNFGVTPVGGDTPTPTAPTGGADEDNAQWFYDRDIEWETLVGSLADWVDAGTNQAYRGGLEDSLYQNLPQPYKAKNSGFDTEGELRLVEGWHRDDVWERFGDRITVYGKSGVNVNTAECPVLWALVKSGIDGTAGDQQVAQGVANILTNREMMPYSDGKVLKNELTALGLNMRDDWEKQVAFEAKLFRIKAGGEVGDAVVTIEAVYDFASKSQGETVYWKME